MQPGGKQLALAEREIRRRHVHRLEQLLRHHVHHEFLAGEDVPRRILHPAGVILADADHEMNRLAAHRIEKTERREIDHARIIDGGHPRDRARHHQVRQQLVVFGVGMLRWIDFHCG